VEGFIWREYSPASKKSCGVERRYFTESNAGRIDAMRALIRDWRESDLIDANEERLLIADLFSALNRVANIAGTFGCFLAKWTPQAAEAISVRPRVLKERLTHVEVSVGDVFDVESDARDVVYLDPPYTKRQYASYYHILETVALGDEPSVSGVAGLRPWKDLASDFCYKVRALKTLSRLVDELKSERILLSYSSEGHIALDDLQAEIATKGDVTIHPLGTVGRYRPNRVASSTASDVKEFLIVIKPNAADTYVREARFA
jgi:adenine-specific DNA-methyltransferase